MAHYIQNQHINLNIKYRPNCNTLTFYSESTRFESLACYRIVVYHGFLQSHSTLSEERLQIYRTVSFQIIIYLLFIIISLS
jgi:hypothetical protein